MRSQLESQADQIEKVLAQHRVTARVTGGLISPRWVQFKLLPEPGTPMGKIAALADELALALGADACRISRLNGKPFDQACPEQSRRAHGKLALEIPRAHPRPVRLLPLQQRLARRGEIPPATAVVGLTENGAPLLLRLSSPQVGHLLIAGDAGAGKSALMRSLVASLAAAHRQEQLRLVLIEVRQHPVSPHSDTSQGVGGRCAFGPLAGLPNLLWPVLRDPADVIRALRSLVELTRERGRGGRGAETANRPGAPRVVVVVDGLGGLLSLREARRALARLARQGHEADVHLLACARKPDGDLVAGFPLRFVGRVASSEAARVATGYSGTGAERLCGPGRFVAVAGGQVTRFDAAYVTGRELAEVVCHRLLAERRQIAATSGATVRRPEEW
jgi:S-DNA-T family DNA segregation ATPase FtsK/SpoIIIE